jgi:hypothetical protein
MQSDRRVLWALAALLICGANSGPTGRLAEAGRRPGSDAAFTRVWKSQTTGNEYRLDVGGDVLHAEWINVPADLSREGAYVRTECRRVGDKWIGTTRSRLPLPCTEVSLPDGRHPSAWCSLVTRTEIDSIAPDRITGRAQAPTRLDCRACKLLDAEWKDFIWTPKR